MKHGDCKTRSLLLPSAVAVTTVILFCFFWSTQFSFIEGWSNEELRKPAGLALGDGPNTLPESSNELTFRLHPEKHMQRKPQKFELQWNITTGVRSPDGVSKTVYMINGQFPGPQIEIRSGDELIVEVRNQLEGEDVAIHWHGLRVANEMDGVVGLTQSGIPPSEVLIYHLVIPDDQSGTFWWHSHSESQRADGLFGSLIVHAPDNGNEAGSEAAIYGYDEEQVLMVGDWYHRPAKDVLNSYTDWRNFKIEPAPDSLLINGLGHFNCSMALKARPLECEEVKVPSLALSRRTRVRIVNTGALTGISIAVTGYSMRVIQVDGGHAVDAPWAESVGVLYPGERIDVVFERHEGASASMEISIDRENMGFPNLALTAQQQFPIMPVDADLSTATKTRPDIVQVDLSKLSGSGVPPGVFQREPDEVILLYATIKYLTRYEYRPKGFFNHTSWPPESFKGSPLATLDRGDWPNDPPALIPSVAMGATVDIVINNLDDKGHPIHLHGYEFFVIARHQPSRMGAFEQYNPFERDKDPPGGAMNLESPLKKDTVYVPSMGYVVLRFQADSPGLWLLHCHVLWHGAVGMNMALEVTGGSDHTLGAAAKPSMPVE